MENLILIFFCMGAGFISRRFGGAPPDAHKGINFWIINFGLPSLILRLVPGIDWNLEMLFPILMPVLLWFLAVLYVRVLAHFSRALREDRASQTVVLVCCGLGNTGFFGYPMLLSFYGELGLTLGIVFDSVIIFLFSLFGISAVLKTAGSGGEKMAFGVMARRILTFPPLLAVIVSIVLSRFISFEPFYPFLDLLMATVIPLALFSIGMQFDFKDRGQSMGLVYEICAYKLIFSPGLVLLLGFLLGINADIVKSSVFQAGTPSHVMVCVIASQFGLNPRLCALAVAISIVLALITQPLWYLVMEMIF